MSLQTWSGASWPNVTAIHHNRKTMEGVVLLTFLELNLQGPKSSSKILARNVAQAAQKSMEIINLVLI